MYERFGRGVTGPNKRSDEAAIIVSLLMESIISAMYQTLIVRR